jgi:hypothetical protein
LLERYAVQRKVDRVELFPLELLFVKYEEVLREAKGTKPRK